MIITDVKLFLTNDNGPKVYVKIETDEGISGYGESTIFFMPQGPYGLLQDIRPYLIGEDPERIEHIWQICYRTLFYRGGPVTGAAIAGIDIALWDIKGKKYNMPIYQLLGGLAREKVLAYGAISGMDKSSVMEYAKERVSRGVKYIRYRGLHDHDSECIHDHQIAVEQTIEYLAAIREAIGYETGIILECHGRYDPRWAIELANRAEKYKLFLIEDPIRHENPQIMSEIKQKTNIAIATGERYHSKWEFRETIDHRYVDYIRPDICHCGGITEMKKIAAMAEVNYIKLIPHNNAGPIGTAATIHAALAIPNIELVEAPFINSKEHNYKIASEYPTFKNGFIQPINKPGLGIEFDEDMANKSTCNVLTIPKLKGLDGSVQDY